jgi:hypothetical protein
MSEKVLAQGNNGLPLTWFEPTWPAGLRLLVQSVTATVFIVEDLYIISTVNQI